MRSAGEFGAQEMFFDGYRADVQELIGGERFGNSELKIVG